MTSDDLSVVLPGRVAIKPGEPWISQLPQRTGIYAIVLGRRFPRLRGETDILRIGHAPATVQGRFRGYWQTPVGNDRDVKSVLKSLLAANGFLVVHFGHEGATVEELLQQERELICGFFDEHLELPPLNRQRPQERRLTRV